MDTRDPAAVNWLRLAFDEIAADERSAIDVNALLTFAQDPKRAGRARRVALDLADSMRPGARDRLLSGWLDDPEFQADAIDKALDQIRRDKQAPKVKALAALRTIFDASRELAQVQAAAGLLKERGVEVSVAQQMGFLRHWYLVGPFDGLGKMGFRTSYPPEQAVDLTATLTGKAGRKLHWQRFTAPESNSGRFPVLVNLRQPLGDAEDAVAYAWTAFEVPKSSTAELRGAADDNLTVWVNGKRVFAFEEYHNGVRLDRHRFGVTLSAGCNSVLVKIVQAPVEPDSDQPNWEFLLRITNPTGKGLTFPLAPSMR
jgi:hypothetical protein